MLKFYWWLCNWMGYQISLQHDWGKDCFTLEKKNTYIVLFKYISKRDDTGWRKLQELYRIKIR